MNLVGYIRVSTEGQVDAFGKEVQIGHIQDWADMNGHTIVEWLEEDAVSGTVDGGDRPVFRSILDRAAEFDGVVAFDSTRVARRLIVQETLFGLAWAAGLRVYTTTAGEINDDGDPTKILIRQILGVIAEFDHRSIVKRLHDARRAKIRKGGYAGGVTRYGVAVKGTGRDAQLVADVKEAEVVQAICQFHSAGHSLRYIAEVLNKQEIRTKMGKQWSATQVQRIIKRRCDALSE
jgi:DNA invertase Pin-like site-specific DNA recombinase